MITDEKHCRLRTIFLKDGTFCTEKRSKQGSKTIQLWDPVNPQQTEQNLVKIHRYYTKQNVKPHIQEKVDLSKFKKKTTLHLLSIVANKKKSADLMEIHTTKKSIILERFL